MIMKNHHPTNLLVYSLMIVIFSLCPCCMIMGMAQRNETTSTRVVKVGGVLDLTTGMVGKIGLSCIKMSLSDFYLSHSHYNTRLQLTFKDSHGDVVTAASQGSFLLLSLDLLWVWNDTCVKRFPYF